MEWWITNLTSGLSMPIPNAIVAMTAWTSPDSQRRWTLDLKSVEIDHVNCIETIYYIIMSIRLNTAKGLNIRHCGTQENSNVWLVSNFNMTGFYQKIACYLFVVKQLIQTFKTGPYSDTFPIGEWPSSPNHFSKSNLTHISALYLNEIGIEQVK